MEFFNAKIIIPSTLVDSKDKIQEHNIRAFITGFNSNLENRYGQPFVAGHSLNLRVEKNNLELIRKLCFTNHYFDLELQDKRYIGCYISEEKSVDSLQVEDCIFYTEIKIEYLRMKNNE